MKIEVKEKSVRCTEPLFYAYFIVLSLVKGMGLYEGQFIFEVCVALAIAFGIAKVLFTPYTKLQWCVQIVGLLLMLATYFCSREKGILFFGLLILGMKGISAKKIMRVSLWVWSFCGIFQCLINFTRLEDTIYRVHDKLHLGSIFRWSLGFTHPNILHITYLMICALIIYNMDTRYRFKQFFFLMMGNSIIFLYSVSYTGFAITTLLLISSLYVTYRPKFCFIERILVNMILPVILILSFLCPLLLFDNRWAGYMQKLNRILNTRLFLAWYFLKPEYTSLFGKDITHLIGNSVAIDSSYVWTYIKYGLVPLALLMIGYLLLIAYDTHKQKTRELVLILCILMAGWTEPFLFNTSFKNISLIFLGEFLYAVLLHNDKAKEYTIMPFKEKVLVLPAGWVKTEFRDRLKQAVKKTKKRIWIFAVAGAMVGIVMCFFIHREPLGYVVPRVYTDGLDKESVYLQAEDDENYKGYKVMNYKSADEPMQIITGNAMRLETARYYVGSIIIGAFLIASGYTIFVLLKEIRNTDYE